MGERFLSIIRGEETELCPLDEAIISDTISHLADIAIRTERKVTWDPIVGEIGWGDFQSPFFIFCDWKSQDLHTKNLVLFIYFS